MTDIAARLANLTPEQRDQLKQRLAKPAARAAAEPIAIIGVGCRFPGGATSPEAFFARLLAGMDAIRRVPVTRWSLDGANAHLSPWGAFLDNLDQFDPGFFGLSPREAAHMDPQQRLLLETAWEALEDAGQMTDGLAESATGVFIGAHSHSSDYYQLQAEAQTGFDTYTATGSAHSILANRLSFLLDLRGPSLTTDTACSSSLVAVHLACQSLRSGESDMAIAGGVNLMLTPDFYGCLSHMEMLSPDGRCKTFDSRANGFVRGEGCGVVVLKRLADAQRDDDPIIALILGSSVNQDGASNGLTAPNGLAQKAVIRRALAVAQVAPAEVGYVETHGTGTELGDPIEVEALAAVLRPDEDKGTPCILGALKTNIGHLEGAAGIAGLIKAALVLRNELVPPNLHLQSINPHLAEHASRFTLPATAQPWPRGERRRVAGVSSFGFGGTNAHILLAEAPLPAPARPGTSQGPLLLPLSARSDAALRALAEDYITHLSDAAAAVSAPDIAHLTAHRRLHHDHRMCVVGADPAQWATKLRRQLAETPVRPASTGANGLVFVFSGQGGQRPQAGAQLYKTEPVFQATIEACDAALRGHAGFSLIDEMMAPAAASRLSRADIGQPAQFALQAGLSALWRSWGIVPSTVVGHSLGEVAAAHAAGALSLEDAITVVFHRGRILQGAIGLGGMAMVGLSAQDTAVLLAKHDPAITIAAFNSPISCILSGPIASLQALVASLQGGAVFARMLDTDYPSHSPVMDRFADQLETALAGLTVTPSVIPVLSTVTGALSAPDAFGPAYWARNLRQPVLFAQAIETLVDERAATFLEISPQPVLRVAIEQCEREDRGRLTVVASLARDAEDDLMMREGAASLYNAGAALDWARLAPTSGRSVILPRYPWDRQSYWLTKIGTRAPRMPAAPVVPPSWLYELSWQPAEPVRRGGVAAFAPVDLARSGEAIGRDLAWQADRQDDAGVLRERLDALSAHYILGAFGALGADVAVGALWPKHNLAARLAIEPRFARLCARMIDILVNQDILVDDGDNWRVAAARTHAASGRIPALDDRAEPASGLLHRCGPQLAEVLRGTVEPLALLFDDNGISAEAIYRDAAPSVRSNGVLGQAVKRWLSDVPGDVRIRILEIGAGTGATTSDIVPLLPQDRCDYVFTDVSPAFLAKAAEQFAGYPFMRYELLDLEQDLAAQGFEAGGFDLIIAANVLHATRDIRDGLVRMQDLLADGGLVTLVECTGARPWMDVTFGLTDGWWRFTDNGLRPTHPLLAPARWLDVLAASGFVDGAAIPLQGAEGDALFDQALIVAHRPIRAPVTAPAGHRYVIVDPGSQAARMLADRIRARGDTCVIVGPHQRFDASDASHAIIYFAPDQRPELSFECSDLLALTQRLIRERCAPTRGLWIITSGCQSDNGLSDAALGQSLLWGFGRGIALEAPDLAPVLVDLDPTSDAAARAAAVLEELDQPAREDEIVRRAGTRCVSRIRPLAAGALAAAPPLSVTGRHLVTGGFGRIGSRLAHELAQAGAAELVLIANRPLPAPQNWDRIAPGDPDFHRIDTVRTLEAYGVKVLVEALDFSDPEALPRLFASPQIAERPLQGIWHAAMMLTPQDLAVMDDATLRAMLAVKARAARQLDQLSHSHPLDQFVLFSSTTALWGARTLAHYAAANAYLDALGQVRRAQGRPATVVNWGTWEIIEPASGDQLSQAGRAGLTPMPAGSAFAALGLLVVGRRAQTIVADIDWDLFKSIYEARRPRTLLAAIEASPPEAIATPAPTGEGAIARLRALAPQDREEAVRDLVKRALAVVLGIDPSEPIDRSRGFFDLGMDSLTSVQLRRRLEGLFERSLSTTIAFKYPTIEALSGHILDLLFPVVAALPAPATAVPMHQTEQTAPVDHDAASEEELFEMLAARLSEGRT